MILLFFDILRKKREAKRKRKKKKERRKEGKKERRKEGKKERRKEGKKERRKEGKKKEYGFLGLGLESGIKLLKGFALAAEQALCPLLQGAVCVMEGWMDV